MALLHGTIKAEILDLRLQWRQYLRQRFCFGDGITRLHVRVSLDRAPIARTADVIYVSETSTTTWNQTIRAYCAHNATQVVFSIQYGEGIVGRASLDVADLLDDPQSEVVRPLPVMDAGEPEDELQEPKIRLRIKFHGAYAPSTAEVTHTRFTQHPGCRVTLYQDAHCLDSLAPEIELAGGRHYQRGRCWEDVFDAIDKAQHLVYITGWSVNTSIRLRRGGDGGGETLGELLKRKSDQRVRVLLLVWKDPTSVALPELVAWLLGRNHVDIPWVGQRTHDKDTEAYFRGGNVHCVLVSRSSARWPNDTSHHQKTIIVDQAVPGAAPEAPDDRHIVSFVGGLDLCDGRYDTQSHCLFSTLHAEHEGDFHQICLEGASSDRGGPRMPWHDIHSKIEGAAAWDVLRNFEQRWMKQAGARGDLLVDLTEPWVKQAEWQDKEEAWEVQVFRSIDSTSVADFPVPEGTADSITEVTKAGLVCGEDNTTVDRSVQDAYIHAIRRANKFIYIENQYFIGSAFQWARGSAGRKRVIKVAPQNLVPRELSLKIASKIEAGEPFAVYVVLPMWSDGLPDSQFVQEMLLWQRHTIRMMYKDVADALKKASKTGASPRDYLNFFCLGNREPRPHDDAEKGGIMSWFQTRAQKARRFMIYVHSKMMIVDDEYIIVGSANINHRSVHGARDTEIAMGSYQPHYLAGGARGEVHGFRMSLWYEHLGSEMEDDVRKLLLNKPGDPSCVLKVNDMADANWRSYEQKKPCNLPFHHLLPYPISVAEDGKVTDSMKYFLDTKARVSGKLSFTGAVGYVEKT